MLRASTASRARGLQRLLVCGGRPRSLSYPQRPRAVRLNNGQCNLACVSEAPCAFFGVATMNRLTKLEIQRALLAGRKVEWTNADGKREAIELKEAAQRRLLAYLAGSSVRDAKGLSDEFIDGLSSAFTAEDDPATDISENAVAAQTGPWRLQKIETEGFGGLNTWNGPPFSYEFDTESLILQGPNGSGKSSLIGAILWAMTGERPRDQDSAQPVVRSEVYDSNNRKIGTWPPIACYPDAPSGLVGNPLVRVTLTFQDSAGTAALVERRLEGGEVTYNCDPALNALEVLAETGLLMPSRMPQIRFEKGQTPLTQAVQALTGLDDLIDVGALVEGLCHKGREYLATNQKQVHTNKSLFEAALSEAQRAIKPTGESISAYHPNDTSDVDGPFARLGKRFRERAAALTQVISDDLAEGLDLRKVTAQIDVAGAIAIAREDLATGLHTIPTWKALSTLRSALAGEARTQVQNAATTAESALAEAVDLDARTQRDTRLQLKALAAHWHETHKGGHELTDCPLCEKKLDNAALQAEMEALRRSGEAATRQLTDNVNAIRARLTSALPAEIRSRLAEFASLAPRERMLADLKARLIDKPRVKSTLATFVRLSIEAFEAAPQPELVYLASAPNDPTAADTVRIEIAAALRLLSLEKWFIDNSQAWELWWEQALDGGVGSSSTYDDTGGDDAPKETLAQHLSRLSGAISEAEPYRSAADALGRAWISGRDTDRYQKAQNERESIVESLTPLKRLGVLAEAQARLAIHTLSREIAAILERMHESERFSFKGADLQKKLGLQVHGGFVPSIKIDATLVANTSWLRAVLWAFLFALRAEAVKQIGSDPLPLLILDDPQATFDAEHRLRWAMEIVSLQQATTPIQVILVTHDEIFVELIKNVHGIVGREGIIVSAGPEIGHIGVFEGAALERRWAKTQTENTPAAAQVYISDVRVYVEGLMRLMLRGHAADVAWVTHGFVMGKARDKVRELHAAKLAPWDKSEFHTLVGRLDQGIDAIKFLEMSHHAGRTTLAMAEATVVEAHWRGKLEPALRRSFTLARDHFLIHGGLRALHANDPACALPEGYTDKVKNLLRFPLRGRAAALSGGLAADGRVDLDLSASSSSTLVLGRHFAFRLLAPTIEPVARTGDVLLVREIGDISPKSLVVARCEARVVARRFEIADNHSDIAVLTAHSVNPRKISQPIVIKRSTLELHKIIGVLFDYNHINSVGEAEVGDCGGENAIQRFATEIKGLVEVSGQSAEPIALDGQMLMIGDAVSPAHALTRLEGRPVIAGDGNDARYFKRLRRGEANTVVLESLEISGDFPPVVLTYETGQMTDLKEVWPVHGILFERP